MTQGPRQPLEEKDAEIARLRSMLASLARYVRVNVIPSRNDPALEAIVAQAEHTTSSEPDGRKERASERT